MEPSIIESPSDKPEIPKWKRVIDLALVTIGCPVWIALYVCIALWIRVSTGGPVFYRQERCGYNGKKFVMIKFRSMAVDADPHAHEEHVKQLMDAGKPLTKLDSIGDKRVIPGGALLRSSGLDELPQLINVVRGEMSIVGPRPCTVVEFQKYTAQQRARFGALPGMTGYWQVNGKNKTTFFEMNAMDIHYVRSMSPILDLAIVVQTVPTIISQVLRWVRNRWGKNSQPIAAPSCPSIE